MTNTQYFPIHETGYSRSFPFDRALVHSQFATNRTEELIFGAAEDFFSLRWVINPAFNVPIFEVPQRSIYKYQPMIRQHEHVSARAWSARVSTRPVNLHRLTICSWYNLFSYATKDTPIRRYVLNEAERVSAASSSRKFVIRQLPDNDSVKSICIARRTALTSKQKTLRESWEWFSRETC